MGGLDNDGKFRLLDPYLDSVYAQNKQVFPEKSRLWSINRQKWLAANGPTLTPFKNHTLIVNNACAVGLNATTVVFVGGQIVYERPYQVFLYQFDEKSTSLLWRRTK